MYTEERSISPDYNNILLYDLANPGGPQVVNPENMG
jgi:hypothetical protein